MTHHLTLITTGPTPHYQCLICGKTFASGERLQDVKRDVCLGLTPLRWLRLSHDEDYGAAVPFKDPEVEQIKKGNALIDSVFNTKGDNEC